MTAIWAVSQIHGEHLSTVQLNAATQQLGLRLIIAVEVDSITCSWLTFMFTGRQQSPGEITFRRTKVVFFLKVEPWMLAKGTLVHFRHFVQATHTDSEQVSGQSSHGTVIRWITTSTAFMANTSCNHGNNSYQPAVALGIKNAARPCNIRERERERPAAQTQQQLVPETLSPEFQGRNFNPYTALEPRTETHVWHAWRVST